MIVIIDGKRVNAEQGETILTVARRMNIEIPSLCHHDTFENIGACRLCMVEIRRADQETTRLVSSCEYPVEPGLEVNTSSRQVRESRRITLDLLLARAPESKVLQKLSAETGLEVTRFEKPDLATECIMCGLCIRACEKLGCLAISTVGRGLDKKIGTPFGEPAESCVGCGTCATVCPVNHIRMVDTASTRTIWDKEFEFVVCAKCGTPVITGEYRDFAVANLGFEESYFELCPSCRRAEMAERFGKVGV